MDNFFYYVKHIATIQYTTKFNDHFTNLYQSSIRSDKTHRISAVNEIWIEEQKK